MIPGIDVATSQRSLDFALAYSLGYRKCYVKLGGDNTSARYVAPNYNPQVDAARKAGFQVGHYWVTGRDDPAGSADYFWENRRNPAALDFYVLDNERLDSGRLWTDAECAVFFRRIIDKGADPRMLAVYVGAADLRAGTWSQTEALGINLIVASYGQNTGTRDAEPNLGGRFGGVWAGHQYTSNGRIGGVAVDLNVFQDWAFTPKPKPTRVPRGTTAMFRIRRKKTGDTFNATVGFISHHANGHDNAIAHLLIDGVNDESGAIELEDADLIVALWRLGLDECIANNFAKLPKDGKYLFATSAN
jgi:hypothetical protein